MEEDMRADFFSKFKNPPMENRIKPFWFWNGELDDDELKRQIDEMADKGIGGFFICPRQGMNIPYLSDAWFEKVEKVCEWAEKKKLEVWLYDEFPYPSGAGGGEVVLRHPEAVHTELDVKIWETEGGGKTSFDLGWEVILSVVAVPADEYGRNDWKKKQDITKCVGIVPKEEFCQNIGLTKYNKKRYFTGKPTHRLCCTLPEGKWRVYAFNQKTIDRFKFFGKYIDPCSKEAVHEFISITHEEYYKRLGGKFGNVIKGIFSDEVGMPGKIPWSSELEGYFYSRKKYSLINELPALADVEYPDSGKIRYDYFTVLNDLLVERFYKTVSKWCGEKHLLYATEVPSFRMGTQKYSDIVGGDCCHEKAGTPMNEVLERSFCHYRSDPKSIASLARQLDKKYAMVESFHSVGWTMTLQDAKWMLDFLAVCGINFFNFHAFFYTVDGARKHDAPPSQFYQNSYWKYYRKLADYAARISVINSETEPMTHIAVLDPAAELYRSAGNPMRAYAYMGQDQAEEEKCRAIKNKWLKCCAGLFKNQVEFDHLDTEMLGTAKIENGIIYIGKAAYSILLVSGTEDAESDVQEQIRLFRQTGGVILNWDNIDYRILRQSAPVYLETEEKNRDEIMVSLRRDNQGTLFLLVGNHGKKTVRVSVAGKSKNAAGIYQLDLETGDIIQETACAETGDMEFGGYELKCLMISESERNVLQQTARKKPSGSCHICLTSGARTRIEGNNLLRIDSWNIHSEDRKINIAEGTGAVKNYIDKLPYKVLLTDTFGCTAEVSLKLPEYLHYTRAVQVQQIPEKMYLLMDRNAVSKSYSIAFNGKQYVESGEKFFLYDTCNVRWDLSGAVKKGINELTLKVKIKDMEDGVLDSVYLMGDFGLNKALGIEALQTNVPWKDALRDFPFYCGEFHIYTVLKCGRTDEYPQIELDAEEVNYQCVTVYMNGYPLGTRGFAPYTFQIRSGILQKGENKVDIFVTSALSRLFDGNDYDYSAAKLISLP